MHPYWSQFELSEILEMHGCVPDILDDDFDVEPGYVNTSDDDNYGPLNSLESLGMSISDFM